MPRKSRENPDIRRFILEHVDSHPADIGALVIKTFGISRVAFSGYMRRLIHDGILSAEGNTNAKRYVLRTLAEELFDVRLIQSLEEDVVWRYKMLPHLSDLKKNIRDICHYGFTEILNNAKDHSASFHCVASYKRNYQSVTLQIADEGIGIFEKIQRDFKLADPRSALLELSKGQLTSDPKNHAGEGIFYTSRMFDRFSIRSGFLFYNREKRDDDDWLIETHDLLEYHKGTAVTMGLSMHADWTPQDIFSRFEGDKTRFRKTHVPISLSQYPGESLVSRSQAKRLLSRFDQFSEVMLDFKGVKTIGQPFADEIFRVFKNNNPDIRVVAAHTSAEIERMIAFVQAPKNK